MYIIALIHPFIMGQYICLYDKEKCLKKIISDFDSVPNQILKEVKENQVKEIHLKGNEFFTKKIKENIEKNNNTNYKLDNLIITIEGE